jgi:MoaA/NifB/PqqE/SkfB family radical SAM enzyme
MKLTPPPPHTTAELNAHPQSISAGRKSALNTIVRFLGKIYQKLPFEIPLLHSIYWKYWQKYGRYRRRSGLYFEVHVVDHCNLNCGKCAHFSPLSKPYFIDTAEFEKDIKRMSQLVKNKADTIRLLGGEPLLHENFNGLMKIVRNYFPDTGTRLQILTNGTLLARQDDTFWQTCKTANAEIIITYYPIKLDTEAIDSLVKKWDIKLSYTDYDPNKNKTMFNLSLDKSGGQDILQSYLKCPMSNTCTILKDGKLYMCAISAYINIFNEYFNQDFSISEADYIDIYKIKTVDEIFEFISRPVPFCRYCTHKYEETRTEWKVSAKEISEWIV